MNHMLDKKIIKGKYFIIILGINILVSINGVRMLTFIFLKIQFPQTNLKSFQTIKYQNKNYKCFEKILE